MHVNPVTLVINFIFVIVIAAVTAFTVVELSGGRDVDAQPQVGGPDVRVTSYQDLAEDEYINFNGDVVHVDEVVEQTAR